ncbi:hypothetical protein ACG74X_11700 [Marivita sp. S0852]|uniref:hypothetical protein n=1 Tax=Marivita sp. S0852 TaxID=3373893 RepID=UPI00398287E8
MPKTPDDANGQGNHEPRIYAEHKRNRALLIGMAIGAIGFLCVLLFFEGRIIAILP